MRLAEVPISGVHPVTPSSVQRKTIELRVAEAHH
jgi:hypothetical protein